MTVYHLGQLNQNLSPTHAAPASAWSQLSSQLPQTTNRDIYINNLGENVPTKYSPYNVAQLVKNGAVWIDWCGWPFYDFGSTAFSTLMQNLVGVSVGTSFDIATATSKNPSTNYPRALVTDSPVSSTFVVNNRAVNGTGRESTGFFSSAPIYFYSSFAVKAGRGAYIYAFGNNQTYYLQSLARMDLSYSGQGVPVDEYLPFVLSIINSLPAPSASNTVTPPSCSQYGTLLTHNSNGTWTFKKDYSGYNETWVVDSNCNVVGGPYTHNTSGSAPSATATPTSTGGGSSVSTYPTTLAYVNGKPLAAIAVNNTTYLLYTVLDTFGFSYQIDYSTHTFTLKGSGKQIKGVVQGGTTYIPWDAIPGIKYTSQNGHFYFTDSGAGSAGSSGGGLFSGGSSGLMVAGAGLAGAYFLLRGLRRK